MESESTPFVAAIFIQLLGSTRSNLLYQRVSPWGKREGAGVTKDEKNVKTASTKSTNPGKDGFQKLSKGRGWKRTGCGSRSSALKPALALLNIFKPLRFVQATE